MRVVVLGDIGTAGEFHAGDEAMAEAAVGELAARLDVTVVAISDEPGVTSALYGWESVPRIGFGGLASDAERDPRLADLDRAIGGDTAALAANDPAWDVLRAVSGADAVVITGGGNVNSTWPEHVYERVALARVARSADRPLVVTGQTIGPTLTGRHGALASEMLMSAALVGVRERSSLDIATRLGVPAERICLTTDDAMYHDFPSETPWEVPSEPYVAATFTSHSGLVAREEYVAALGDLVRHVHESTGLEVVLVPHQASALEGTRDGDVGIHDDIRTRAGGAGVHSLPMRPRSEAAVTRGAALVLSTRYHPVVYALGAGVPAIAFATDAYTSTKIVGAMEGMGVEILTLPAPMMLTADARSGFDDVWERRESIGEGLAAANVSRRRSASLWWDAVARALQGQEPTAPPGLESLPQATVGEWSASVLPLRRWADGVSGRLTSEALINVGLRAEVEELKRTTAALEAEHGATVSSLQAELAAHHSSRAFRVLAPARRVWAALRSRRSTRP